MKRRLYLHIGVHRTATTSIQSFLRTNFLALQTLGYFNPFAAGRSAGLFNGLFSGKTKAIDIATDINKRAASKPVPIHSLILSDEDICMRRDIAPLQRFTDIFDVKVVLSLRRQDLWLESWHQQNVKWQWDPALAHLTFPQFLEQRPRFHWIRYDSLIDRFGRVFGPENLIIRVFERGEMPAGPIAAFCADIGLTSPTGLATPAPQNASLTPICSEFLRTLPLGDIKPEHRALIERAAFALDRQIRARRSADAGLLMDHDTRSGILADYAAGNETVARTHFGRDTLFHEPLPPRDAPLSDQRLPGDSYQLVTDFVAPLLAALIDQFALREQETARTLASRPPAPPPPGKAKPARGPETTAKAQGK